jgi:hypothetical protein
MPSEEAQREELRGLGDGMVRTLAYAMQVSNVESYPLDDLIEEIIEARRTTRSAPSRPPGSDPT